MTLTTLRASLINIVLPNRCPACDRFLTAGERLCPDCEAAVLLPHDDYCHTCGKMQCLCKRRTFAYDQALVVSRYQSGPEDRVFRAIWALKNSRNRNFAYFAAIIMADRLKHSVDYGRFDLVTAVPMHRTKQRMRGFNQAALIGRLLAQELEIPYRDDLLFKERSRIAQHNLNAAERARNVSTFGVHPVDLAGKHILLCDDVLTTGATLDRCADLLKSHGAANVTVAAAATTNQPRPDEAPDIPQGGTP